MKARNARTIGFSAASVAALTTAINAWFADVTATGPGERELLTIQYQFDGATHAALVTYGE